MIETPTEIWEKRLQNIFKKKEKSQTQLFLDVVSIVLFMNKNSKELGDLFSILKLDDFIKVVSLFENRTIEFPSKKEIQEAIEISLFYYYKNIRGVESYDELKDLNIIEKKDFSSRSIGKKLTKLDKELKEKMLEILKEIENG